MKVSEFCTVLNAKLEGLGDKEKLALSSLSLQQAFKVAEDEVAFLKLDRVTESLRFMWPEKLRNSGSIPLKTRESFVASTVRDSKPQLHNRFTSKLHVSVFEQVNLAGAKSPEDTKTDARRPKVIQKIMSAPLLKGDALIGAVQVSRKADDLAEAGPDFTDLQLAALAEIAKVIGKHIE